MPQLHVETRSIASLTPNPRNPRSHSAKQIGQIAASIRSFGFNNPILVDDQGCAYRKLYKPRQSWVRNLRGNGRDRTRVRLLA